ncbi:hypothetical protein GJ496_002388 [Pomphorhynchus laevis]|nr:hypothetical protein GJ496_002388 [Pomphorhynchus laevis]
MHFIVFTLSTIFSIALINADLDLKALKEKELQGHNKYRDLHGVQRLRLEPGLDEAAQMHAIDMATQDKIIRGRAQFQGENIFSVAFSVSDKNEADRRFSNISISDSWYKHIDDYDFETGTVKNSKAFTFTQMVWQATYLVGFGCAPNFKTKNRSLTVKYYCCARYYKRGNIQGQFTENVFRPSGDIQPTTRNPITESPYRPTTRSTYRTTSQASTESRPTPDRESYDINLSCN